jgi:hypothetical protein
MRDSHLGHFRGIGIADFAPCGLFRQPTLVLALPAGCPPSVFHLFRCEAALGEDAAGSVAFAARRSGFATGAVLARLIADDTFLALKAHDSASFLG